MYWVWSQFWSHSPACGRVRRWPPMECWRRLRTLADCREQRAAVLESVLGATPQEFESPILRHAGLRKCVRLAAALLPAHRVLSQFFGHGIRAGTRTPETRAPVIKYR